jgi:rhodanese-related sulfurtransferase
MGVKDLVAEARGQVTNLSVNEVATELDGDPVTLIDLREPAEIERDGSIPEAVFVPRGMLEFHADPDSLYHLESLDPDARTILYCASGGRSALGAAAMQRLGYRDVAHLDGGFKAWKEAGRPVTRGS